LRIVIQITPDKVIAFRLTSALVCCTTGYVRLNAAGADVSNITSRIFCNLVKLTLNTLQLS
ncbi:MAG: hypothetical protein WEB89_05605, partial [Balneolales bacterium]